MNTRLTYISLILTNLLAFSSIAAVMADDSRVTIPFEVINGLIIVEAEIDNEVGNYIFDTGAEELILNKEEISGKTMFSSINGELATEEVDINLLRIGNLTHSRIKAYSADLGSMESYLNISLQGVIGCNLFIPRKVKIDFSSKEITLSSTDDLTSDRESFVSFEMMDGVPVCPVSIDGKNYLFGFDTGATMHVIDESVILKINESIEQTGLDTYVTSGIGEKTIHEIWAINNFVIGNSNLNNAHFLAQDLEEFNQSMERPITGVLSLTALNVDDIVIDLQRLRIYF